MLRAPLLLQVVICGGSGEIQPATSILPAWSEHCSEAYSTTLPSLDQRGGSGGHRAAGPRELFRGACAMAQKSTLT